MFSKFILPSTLFLILGFVTFHHASAETSSWQTVTAPLNMTVEVNGQARKIFPGCAFNEDYKFFFKQGNSRKLLVFMNGGGACWNATTCLTSLSSPTPAFVPSIDNTPHNQVTARNGVFDLDNPENPYADWSIAFLPYCTGDIHAGSNDALYDNPANPGTFVPVRHRGFDNVLFAREWLKNHSITTNSVRKLFVSGASAGAYGVILTYPYWKETFPRARGMLLADAGSGVITDEFIDEAMRGDTSSWKIDQNIADWIPGLAEVFSQSSADSFVLNYYLALSNAYPRDNFAQYTTAWDAIQVMFKQIMENDDNIAEWPNFGPEDFAEWTTATRINAFSAASAPNYRFYIAPGCTHTALRYDDRFYSNEEVGGLTFMEWLKGMTQRRKRNDWQNVICDGDCDMPVDPVEVQNCIDIPVIP